MYGSCQISHIASYDRPRELEHRLTPVPGQYGIYETTVHDPESPDYQPAEPERVMIPGRMVTR